MFQIESDDHASRNTALADTTSAASAVSVWPRYPFLYEINTWVWLSDLSRRYGKTVDLSSVPATEWDTISAYGFNAIWLMGVWQRSPAGISIANQNKDLLAALRQALPDFHPDDNVGSPYCVRRYVVDQHLGGPEGLSVARAELSKRGMNLVLDFVPNHVAPDHPWVGDHPEYFIRGNSDEARKDPSSFITLGEQVFARGRDPYFPAWPDVLQLNAFDPNLRQALIETISDIASQCDGIRCDMAMLVLNSVFERTWGIRAGPRPASEYWVDLIAAVKNRHPGFVFIAEAYWDLEWELQQQGFDFCYDKKLYDRLDHSDAESIRLHLDADLAYQNKLVRFVENHDEPRAATTFSSAKIRSAALTVATLPGARLFHEGQFEGRKIRVPVFLGRRPDELLDADQQLFYGKLMDVITRRVFHQGEWILCDPTGWPGNAGFQNLAAWCWSKDQERYMIAVNFSGSSAQARVHVPWADVAGRTWHLIDRLSDATYDRDGDQMVSLGLYVELSAWACHLLEFLPA